MGNPMNFISEYAPDASFGLCTLKKLPHSHMLKLRRYICLYFLNRLELSRSDDIDIVIGYAFSLENLILMCFHCVRHNHEIPNLLFKPVREEGNR